MSTPKVKRFGPVTYASLVSCIVFGLCGLAVANTMVSPDLIRETVIGSVFLGGMVGIVLGAAIEYDRARADGGWLLRVGVQANLLALCGAGFALLLYVAAVVVFGPIAFGLPVLLVWIGGGIIMLTRWHRHQRVSKLALIAIAGFLLTALASGFVDISLTAAMGYGRRIDGSLQIVGYGWQILKSLLEAGCMVLLFAAILIDREPNQANSSPAAAENADG